MVEETAIEYEFVLNLRSRSAVVAQSDTTAKSQALDPK